jgi:secreted PhoX family phosphatase
MNIEYMAYKNVVTLGTIVNKIPKKVSYHTPDKIKEYVSKFFSSYEYSTNNTTTKEENIHKIALYGFVEAYEDENGGSCATSCATSCALKPNVDITEFDLELEDSDWKELSMILKAQNKAVNFTQLFHDVKAYFAH